MSPDEKTNEELGLQVAACAPGIEAHAPFDELYKRLARVSESFIEARINKQHVEDVFQETWQNAWKYACQFTESNNYLAWLLTIARNLIASRHRSNHRHPTMNLTEEMPLIDNQTTDWLVDQEQRQALAECLEFLDARSKTLVKGRFQGMDYDQLCPKLEVSKATAYKIYHLAEKNLTECVQRKMS